MRENFLLNWYIIDDLAAKTEIKILFCYGSGTLLDAVDTYTLKSKIAKSCLKNIFYAQAVQKEFWKQ